MEIHCKINKILPQHQLQNGTTFIEIIVETIPHKEILKISFLNNNTKLLSGFNIGDSVSIMFYLSGKEKQGKYYTNIIGKMIDHLN
jgi:hypothetical protein